jgi:hypothetical protein
MLEQLPHDLAKLLAERFLIARQQELPGFLVQLGILGSAQQCPHVDHRAQRILGITHRAATEHERDDKVQIAQREVGVARDFARVAFDHRVALDRDRIDQRQRLGIERARWRWHRPTVISRKAWSCDCFRCSRNEC